MSIAQPGWLAGSAMAPFPIAPGTPLGGYMARTSPATGTLDPLQIGALHLVTGDRALTLITADVIGVDGDLRDRIAQSAGIDPADVLLCASHTHSGPHGIVRRLHPIEQDGGDVSLRDRFVQIATACVLRARTAIEPVTLDYSAADATGAWTNRNEQDGPNDPRLRLLLARRGDRSIQTILTLTACHPTILGAESTVVSADLAGGMRRQIAKLPEGADATILSLTGAAGDLSARYVRHASTPAEIERLGGIATSNVSAALDTGRPIAASSASLRHTTLVVRMPDFREVLAADPHAAMLAARATMEQVQAQETDPAALRHAITRYQGAFLRWQMASLPATTGDLAVSIDVWVLDDDTALVALPVELFTSLGARIEMESPFRNTLIVGYANGYAGYVADAAAWDSGTYEALASPYARRAGTVLVEEVVAGLIALRA